MKCVKHLTALLLTITMVLGLTVPALAVSESSLHSGDYNRDEIIDALNFVEPQKDMFGLEDVDFTNLSIGNAVHVYEYTEDGFQEIQKVYPLFDETSLVTTVLVSDDGNCQLVSYFANKITAAGVSAAAIVYDATCCYLFDGESFIVLHEHMQDDTRANLNAKEIVTSDDIILTDLSPNENLEYVTPPEKRVQTYFHCPVGFVTQQPNNKLCWAACIACIYNYLRGENLSALDVAKANPRPESLVNSGRTKSEVADIMNNTYNLGYTYKNTYVSDDCLMKNIKNGYPVYGSFYVKDNEEMPHHAAVIYGVDTIAGYIVLMDPFEETAYWGATIQSSFALPNYTYWAPHLGHYMVLDRAVCHSW